MLNGTHIKTKYFECSQELLENTMNKIRNYFDRYTNSHKIKKAYLYDNYNEGEKVLPDKKYKEKITDEEFELHYGSYFDRLKNKISNDDDENNNGGEINVNNYILDDNNDLNNDADLNDKNNDELIENLIKEKIIMIKEIRKKYKSRKEKYLKFDDSDKNSDDELYKEISKVYKKDSEENIDKIEKKSIHSNAYMSKFERMRLIDSDDDIEIEIKSKKNTEPFIEIKNNDDIVKILKQTYKSRTEKYRYNDEY